jgi:hypothetical protein
VTVISLAGDFFSDSFLFSLAAIASRLLAWPPPAYASPLYWKLYRQSFLVLSFQIPTDYLRPESKYSNTGWVEAAKVTGAIIYRSRGDLQQICDFFRSQ